MDMIVIPEHMVAQIAICAQQFTEDIIEAVIIHVPQNDGAPWKFSFVGISGNNWEVQIHELN